MTAVDNAALWSEKYAARFAELRGKEERYRAEAFVELPRFVAGEPLRVMTPRDLHMLDGCRNAFVCGTEPDPGHVAAFIWQLHARRPARPGVLVALRLRLLYFRLCFRAAEPALAELREYLDFVFFDSPSASTGREVRLFGGSFLAVLLGEICGELGPFDPVLGRPWGDVPLPQVFHFYKVVARIIARREKREFIDRNPSDRLLSDFAAELNSRGS